MAINITVQGNQLKIIEGANAPKYVNSDDADIAISGDKVGIMQTSSNNLVINVAFGDYATPSGGSAEIVADAIAALLGTAAGGGGGGGTVQIAPAIFSAVGTLTTSTSSAPLFASRATRVDVVMRNGTNQLADVKRFGVATTGAEAIQLQPGEEKTLTGWAGDIEVVFAAVGTGTFYAEETYI